MPACMPKPYTVYADMPKPYADVMREENITSVQLLKIDVEGDELDVRVPPPHLPLSNPPYLLPPRAFPARIIIYT